MCRFTCCHLTYHVFTCQVSVLFADMHGLSDHSQQQTSDSTAEIIIVMNQMHTAFERLLTKHKVSWYNSQWSSTEH